LTTGLKNKNYIFYNFPEVMQNKGNCNYQIILIDLDDFKTFNGVLGCDFGNKMLNEVGKIYIKRILL
jgi:GGDEF domain-containing protein